MRNSRRISGRRSRPRRTWLGISCPDTTGMVSASWGLSFTLTSTPVPLIFPIVGFLPQSASSPPPLESLEVVEVRGHIDVTIPPAAALQTTSFAWGLYKALWDDTSPNVVKWSTQNVISSLAASRDDWLKLDGITVISPPALSLTSVYRFSLPCNWRGRIAVREGEALCLAIAQQNAGLISSFAVPWIRTHLQRVV